MASYYLYNLQIKLEDRAKLLIGTLHLLSIMEQEVLKNFISENLNTGFIHPIFSPYRMPILFVKKKDNSLYLCVNFQELNCIIQEDRYPPPLIFDFLTYPRKHTSIQRLTFVMYITQFESQKTMNGKLPSVLAIGLLNRQLCLLACQAWFTLKGKSLQGCAGFVPSI